MSIEKIWRPCPHCGRDFGGRELRAHEAHCPERAMKANNVPTPAEGSPDRGSFTDLFRRRQDAPTEDALSHQQELQQLLSELRQRWPGKNAAYVRCEAERLLAHRMSTSR